jgi:hypothetical protein
MVTQRGERKLSKNISPTTTNDGYTEEEKER